MKGKLHNTHILIPEKLWTRVRRKAESEGTTKTEIVCRALARYLRPRKEKS
jgi:hypothetical protein